MLMEMSHLNCFLDKDEILRRLYAARPVSPAEITSPIMQ